MNRKKPDVDVVKDVLEAVLAIKPEHPFTLSLLQQYQERGSLSKKQLEGLIQVAQKTNKIHPGKITTIEAIVKRMPTRQKSEAPVATPLFVRDESVGVLINDILAKYPQHKRVLFFKARYENNEPLTTIETDELKKFARLLLK